MPGQNIRWNSSPDTKSSLVRDARQLLGAWGVERSANWISRKVRAFLASPMQGPFEEYLAAELDLRYLRTYADPTGETAIRNVIRDRGY